MFYGNRSAEGLAAAGRLHKSITGISSRGPDKKQCADNTQGVPAAVSEIRNTKVRHIFATSRSSFCPLLALPESLLRAGLENLLNRVHFFVPEISGVRLI